MKMFEGQEKNRISGIGNPFPREREGGSVHLDHMRIVSAGGADDDNMIRSKQDLYVECTTDRQSAWQGWVGRMPKRRWRSCKCFCDMTKVLVFAYYVYFGSFFGFWNDSLFKTHHGEVSM